LKRGKVIEQIGGGLQCIDAHRPAVALLEVERREKAIAMNLRIWPLLSRDRPGHRLEIRVEDLQQLLVRHAIRDVRIAAQIAKPDHRADMLHRTPVDLAGEHMVAGIGTDVGLEQRARDIERRTRFHGKGKVGQRVDHLFQVSVVEAPWNVGRARKEDAPQRIEFSVASAAVPFFREAVSVRPKLTIRAAYSVIPASRNSSSNRNCSGSPVSSRRRKAGSPELRGNRRASQVRLAFLAGAPPRKCLLFQPLRAPYVAACTVPRMQRPNDQARAARRKAGLHHAPAEPVEEILDRHAAQPLLDDPLAEPGEVEWQHRASRSSCGRQDVGLRHHSPRERTIRSNAGISLRRINANCAALSTDRGSRGGNRCTSARRLAQHPARISVNNESTQRDEEQVCRHHQFWGEETRAFASAFVRSPACVRKGRKFSPDTTA
jgi:hypothetical protein